MRKHVLMALLLLASCASQKPPNLAEQPADTSQYQADLAYCEDWAKPTRHEWAMRCEASGDLVLVSSVLDSLSAPDPRDQDHERQSMPNNTGYRLTMCLRAKGYKIDLPKEISKTASR